MAQFQSYNALLVSGDDMRLLRAGDAILGYELFCGYPSYRGTFLSCIESFALYVDGARVPDETIYFHLNGKQFLLSQLKDLYMEYWFVLDKARLTVLREGGLPAGRHEVTIRMRHRIPYTGYFGTYLVLDGADTKTLNLAVGEGESA